MREYSWELLHCENFASEPRVKTKTQEWLVFNSNIFLWLLSTSFSRFVCFTWSTLSFEIVQILAILVIKKNMKIHHKSYHVLLVLLTIKNINVRQQIFKNIFSHSCKYCHKMNFFCHFNPQSYTFYTHLHI